MGSGLRKPAPADAYAVAAPAKSPSAATSGPAKPTDEDLDRLEELEAKRCVICHEISCQLERELIRQV
jgi:hypothetical protein